MPFFRSLCRSILIVAISAFVLRLIYFLLIYFLHPEGYWSFDSYGYWNIANNLYLHGAYSQFNNLAPDFLRTPIYPFYLLIFQSFPFAVTAAIFVQVLLGTVSAVITFRIARMIFSDPKIALLSGMLVAIDIPSIIFSNYLLTETMFTFLLLISVFYLLKYNFSDNRNFIWISFFFLGLTILCRPVALFLPIIWSAFLILRATKTPLYNKIAYQLIPGLVILLITMIPWLVRNQVTFDRIFISTIGKYVLHNYHATAIISKSQNIDFETAQYNMRVELYEDHCRDKANNEVECADFAYTRAKSIISKNLSAMTGIQLKNMLYVLLKPARGYIDRQLGLKSGYNTISGDTDLGISKIITSWSSKTSLTATILVILQILWLVFFLSGTVTSWRFCVINKETFWFVFIGSFVFYFALMTVPPVSDARLRVPAVPFMSLLAAPGIYYMLKKLKLL